MARPVVPRPGRSRRRGQPRIPRPDGAASDDEARELAAELPGVPHVQNPDRVAAAREAVRQFQCRAIILDDAFQHRRIGRDLDIVLLDALEPLGFGHVFPRGTLREPLEGLRRADLVALSRADMLEPDRRAGNPPPSRAAGPAGRLAGNNARPADVARPPAENGEPLESLRGRPVAAFCGVGNPAGFRHTLSSCGYQLAGFREFPDHHAYTPHRLEGPGRLGQTAVRPQPCFALTRTWSS